MAFTRKKDKLDVQIQLFPHRRLLRMISKLRDRMISLQRRTMIAWISLAREAHAVPKYC